jgi:hypothetical protein
VEVLVLALVARRRHHHRHRQSHHHKLHQTPTQCHGLTRLEGPLSWAAQ